MEGLVKIADLRTKQGVLKRVADTRCNDKVPILGIGA
jgi:hypothetical protein